MKHRAQKLVCRGLLVAGALGMAGCAPSPFRAARVEGEYVNYPHAMRLILNEKDRSLLMTQGREVLSSGTYYVKWQRLYCRRDNRAVVIGRVNSDRIVTDMGDFVRED